MDEAVRSNRHRDPVQFALSAADVILNLFSPLAIAD